MFRKTISAAIAVAALVAMPSLATADADGAKLFKKKCGVCHSTDAGKHKVGPSLAGIVGRKAGTVEGYKKYKALKGSDLIWDDANLDGWITNPKKFIGKKTAMSGKLKKEDERKAVIKYLKGL